MSGARKVKPANISATLLSIARVLAKEPNEAVREGAIHGGMLLAYYTGMEEGAKAPTNHRPAAKRKAVGR